MKSIINPILFFAVSISAISLLINPSTSQANETTVNDNVVEKGAVNWSNDLDAAKKLSAKTGRPIFLLFQEVPG